MIKSNAAFLSAPDEEFLQDVEDIMGRLRQLGAKYFMGSVHEEEEVLDLALDIAEEAQRRMRSQKLRIQHLEALAVTDELTGLLNRRGFENRLREEVAHASRHGEDGLLIYVDLDKFKPVNDAYGHAAGDLVLRKTASVIRGAVRETDVVGRLGGDEFAILMPRSNHAQAMARALGLRRALNSSQVDWNGQTISLAASVGACAYTGQESWERIMSHADLDMYLEKADREARQAATLPHRAVAR